MQKKCPNVNGQFKQGDTAWPPDSVLTFLIDSFGSGELTLSNAQIYHKDASAQEPRECQTTRPCEGEPIQNWVSQLETQEPESEAARRT